MIDLKDVFIFLVVLNALLVFDCFCDVKLTLDSLITKIAFAVFGVVTGGFIVEMFKG